MKAGAPDPPQIPVAPGESLAARLAQAMRRRAVPRTRLPDEQRPRAAARNRRPLAMAAALAALIAAGPLLTGAGARLLRIAVDRDIVALQQALAPRLAADHDRAVVRDTLKATLANPGPAETLDRIAAVLPADARLVRVERLADQALELDIATADPDALRAALHRAPMLAGLRDVGQRQADGMMIVSLRKAAR
jgi:hypothetical protein